MRLLLLGDIVGRAGRTAVVAKLLSLRRELAIDAVIVNAENAAGGFGLTPPIADELLAAGADVLTLGNHSFDQRNIIAYLSQSKRVIRPLNYPLGTAGEGITEIETPAGIVVVAQVMGQVFMPNVDHPYNRLMEALARYRLGGNVAAIVIDVHAEAASEKQAFAHALDGLVSVVVGTHTHVPTSDTRILPGGTALQTDLGMCGDYQSVIGFMPEAPVHRLKSAMPSPRLAAASGEATLCGLLLDLDKDSGLAVNVQPLRVGGALSPAMPRVV